LLQDTLEHSTAVPCKVSRPVAASLAGESDSRTGRPLAETASIERLLWRLDQVAHALNVSRRVVERERSAGRFPRPDLVVGRMPLWKPETIRAWIDNGGVA
jgi:hypothetical protein